ncbi:MAG: hypothetical protein R3B72_41530 [Polyangiaceae bacterium]
MTRGCDVCQGFRPEANLRDRPLAELAFDGRLVVLCNAHRRIAANNGVTSFEGLRELYGEADGRRSHVARRSGTSHLGAPERRARGRRSSDQTRQG